MGEYALPMRDELLRDLIDQHTELEAWIRHDLRELRRLQGWMALQPPERLRDSVFAERERIADRLVERLLAWAETGGEVRLWHPADERVEDDDTDPTADTPIAFISEDVVPEETPVPGRLEAASKELAESVKAPEPEDQRGPPPSPIALEALVQRIQRGDAQISAHLPAVTWRADLDALLARVAPSYDDEQELERLSDLVDRCDEWTAFPKSVQRQLVGLCAARMRRLQDDCQVQAGALNRAFSTLTRFSARERPGFVVGLTRTHSPRHGSWEEDAGRFWDELDELRPQEPADDANREQLLAEVERVSSELPGAPAIARSAVESQLVRAFRAALDGGVRARDPGLVRLASSHLDLLDDRAFKSLRRAARDAEAQAAKPQVATSSLPEDWGWLSWSEGRRAILVGGSPREERRQALEAEFRFESLVWEDTMHRPQTLQTISKRVEAGTYDLVLILGEFIGHDTDDVVLAACKESGVAWAHVDRGYGATRIRGAIERFLEPEPSA